jgi:hypothetical protein
MKSRKALKDIKDKNVEASRMKYGGIRKKYERNMENKKAAWQSKQVEWIDILVTQKEIVKYVELLGRQ